MAAPVRTLCCSVLRLTSRPFSTTCGVQAGDKWRREHGLSRTGSEYGPLTDLPDWSFAAELPPTASLVPSLKPATHKLLTRLGFPGLKDVSVQQKKKAIRYGRPAPPMKGQMRRKQEREAIARRIVMLSSEMDQGMEAWREKQEEAKRMEEHKKSLLLKPKGDLLRKKSKK